MQFLFLSSIPVTRIFSFQEYRKHQNGKRQDYILKLLETIPDGLTCREISQISGIEIQSLTYPLKQLEEAGQIKVSGVRKSELTNRHNQTYVLNNRKSEIS